MNAPMTAAATVETLRGPVPADGLGRVLIHEHVFIMDVEYSCNYRPDAFADETIAAAADRLNALKATGIDTIVDLTVLGIGSFILVMRRKELAMLRAQGR